MLSKEPGQQVMANLQAFSGDGRGERTLAAVSAVTVTAGITRSKGGDSVKQDHCTEGLRR